MQVNQVFQTPEGAVKFEGELSQAEADVVVRAGLNWLMQQGALPISTEGDNIPMSESPEQ